MNRMGYACINMQLSNQKPRIYTGRSMIKRTFTDKGISYASQLGLDNCKDLFTIIKWNNENGFKFFRITSNLFPNILCIKSFSIMPDGGPVLTIAPLSITIRLSQYNEAKFISCKEVIIVKFCSCTKDSKISMICI